MDFFIQLQVDIYENPSEHYGFMGPLPASGSRAGSAEDVLKPVYYMEEEDGGPLLKVGYGEMDKQLSAVFHRTEFLSGKLWIWNFGAFLQECQSILLNREFATSLKSEHAIWSWDYLRFSILAQI